MMIKLNKYEVEQACGEWLRAGNYQGDKRRTTTPAMPVAIDSTMEIICTHTRSGVDCFVGQKS